jgi:hypothetical protein
LKVCVPSRGTPSFTGSYFLQTFFYLKLRYCYDENYWKAVGGLEFWDDRLEGKPTVWDDVQEEYEELVFRLLAGVAREANYPLDFGSWKELNAVGHTMNNMDKFGYYHRSKLDPSDEEKSWMTFRDYKDGHNFHSLHTGTKAVSLEKPWMKM